MESMKDMLTSGEKILVSTRFSFWTVGWRVARDAFSAGACLLVGASIPGLPDAAWIGAAGAALFLADMAWAVAKYRNNRIWITDRRLIAQTGWPGRDMLDLPFDRIESANVVQSLRGRMLDFGDLELAGIGSTHARLRFVRSPLAFKRSLDQANGRSAGPAGKAAPKAKPKA